MRGEWVHAPEVAGSSQFAVMYIHGGGFTAGTAAAYRGLSSRIGRAARCGVLAIDYRLAPEHPFPAALDDCVAAYRWLVGEAGLSPRQLVVVGNSAGGNLAVALLLRLRDSGQALPAAAVCISAVFDLALTGASVTERAGRDPVISSDSLRACSRAYLGRTDPRHPLASPLYADLAGLPQLLIQVGSEEMLRDDSVRLAERAVAAGVQVALDEWPGMIHVWHLYAAQLREGSDAIDRVGAFVRAQVS